MSRIDALASYTKGGESGQMVNPTVVTIISQLEAHVAKAWSKDTEVDAGERFNRNEARKRGGTKWCVQWREA
jgi:hypothetical protein